MNEHKYTIPALTCRELVALRCAIREDVGRFYKWRKDSHWRQTIRECIAAYRKLQRMEVAP